MVDALTERAAIVAFILREVPELQADAELTADRLSSGIALQLQTLAAAITRGEHLQGGRDEQPGQKAET